MLPFKPGELARLGQVRSARGAQHGGCRALDGAQRRPQLMAHHGQELGPLALQLLERRQVLQGDHHRLDRAVGRTDRRGVDQRRDAPAVGDRQRDLLGAHGLGAAQLLRHRELGQGDLAAVAAAAGDHAEQLLDRRLRHAQRLDDPPRLPVERHEPAAPAVEDGDAYRARLDQGLEVGPGPPLVAVRAGVGDGRRRLRGEQDQDLLVGARELRPALLLAEEEVADVDVAVPHRRALHRLRHDQLGREAQLPDVGRQVRHPQRLGQVPEVREEPRSVRPRGHHRVHAGGEAGGDEVLRLPGVVDGSDHAVAGAGQRAGAVDDLAQDGLEVEAGADAQDGRRQARDAVLEHPVPLPQLVGTLLHHPSLRTRRAGRPWERRRP